MSNEIIRNDGQLVTYVEAEFDLANRADTIASQYRGSWVHNFGIDQTQVGWILTALRSIASWHRANATDALLKHVQGHLPHKIVSQYRMQADRTMASSYIE